MQTFSVARYQLRGLLAALEQLGIDPVALLAEAEIDAAQLDDVDARFSELSILRLWGAAETRWADPLLGLEAGRRVPFGALELMDYLIGSGETVAEVFTCLGRYARLCASGITYDIAEAGAGADAGVVIALCHPMGMELWPASVIEYLWTLIVARLRAQLGERLGTTLRFRHAARGPVAAYRRVLGHVEFEKPRSELYLPRDVWLMQNPRADAGLVGLLERYAREALERLVNDDHPLHVVRRELLGAMREGDASVERLAKRMALSTRTLQRRLADAGYTFRQLVDEMREEAGRNYIERTELSLGEISYLLGYSDPSAFNRAFRRWTGNTPAEYRLRHRRESRGVPSWSAASTPPGFVPLTNDGGAGGRAADC